MFIEIQCAYSVLKKWKHDPRVTKHEIGLWAHWKCSNVENDRRLFSDEVETMKQLLRCHAPSSYRRLFGE